MNPGNPFDRSAPRRWMHALAIGALGSTAAAQAGTLVVTNTGDDANTACNTETCNLRAAILAAQNGDEIVFSPNLPYPVTIRLASALDIGKNLVIRHPVRGAVTLDARPGDPNAPGYRVLQVSNQADVTLVGLRLVHGRTLGTAGADGASAGAAGSIGGSGEGGCAWVGPGSRLTLHSVVVSGCEARGGNGGTGTLGAAGQAGSTGAFQQDGRNGGAGGKGGAGGRGGPGWGGGIFTDGDLILIDSSVVANTSRGGFGGNGGEGGKGGRGGNGGPGGGTGTGGNGGGGGDGGDGGAAGPGGVGYGGGVLIGRSGTVYAVNSVIANNQALGESNGAPGAAGAGGSGGNGGVGGEQGEPGFDGSAGVEGARARPGDGIGGGISTNGGSNTGLLSFTSIVGNSAMAGPATATSSMNGGALAGGLGSAGFIEVRNSIIATNTAGLASVSNCYLPPVHASGVNLTERGDCGFALVAAAPGVVYDDSGVVPLARLEATSPAVDAVADCTVQTNGVLNTVDVRGTARPQDGDGNGEARCDIGAYEAEASGTDVVFRNGFDA